MMNNDSSSTGSSGLPPGGIVAGSETASSMPSELLAQVLEVSELLGV